MEPITTTLLLAIVSGAAAAVTQTVAGEAIVDGYNSLKALVLRKVRGKEEGLESDLAEAIAGVEKEADSKGRQILLEEKWQKAVQIMPALAQDRELLAQSQTLLQLLKDQGQDPTAKIHIEVSGSGAAAYGAGAKAAGQGGVVADTISGPVSTGDKTRQIQAQTYTEKEIRTDGGAYVQGNVDTGGGDFVGRDQQGE